MAPPTSDIVMVTATVAISNRQLLFTRVTDTQIEVKYLTQYGGGGVREGVCVHETFWTYTMMCNYIEVC